MKNPTDLPIVKPNAAGIDVGSEKFFASIEGKTPRVFLTVTEHMHKLCDYLQEEGVKSVAMEATGVYWLNLYSELEKRKFEVVVVNGAHCKNVPGRKTDMKDCQWISVLHAHGMLKGGFIPTAEVRELREYVRTRGDLVSMAAQHVQHMQKALDLLNVKIHVVISSITGVSGMRIIQAILDGERNAKVLVELCDHQILKTKRTKMEDALNGNWGEGHLFCLRLARESYEHYQKQIAQSDEKIARCLMEMSKGKAIPEMGKAKELRHNALNIDGLQEQMAQVFGRDLTKIPCINESTAVLLLAEIGSDMSRWPTVKHFGSWLALAPSSAQSGKMKRRLKRGLTPAAKILCRAVQCMASGKHTWLASFYRRIRAKRGAKVAIKAAAYKVARMIYMVLTKGWDYVETGIKKYQEQITQIKVKTVQKLAKELNFNLVPKTM